MVSTSGLLLVQAKQLVRKEVDIGKASEGARLSRLKSAEDLECRNASRMLVGRYKPGTMVLVYQSYLDNQHSGKDLPCWVGPYAVASIEGNGSYQRRELDGTLLRHRTAAERVQLFFFRKASDIIVTTIVDEDSEDEDEQMPPADVVAAGPPVPAAISTPWTNDLQDPQSALHNPTPAPESLSSSSKDNTPPLRRSTRT